MAIQWTACGRIGVNKLKEIGVKSHQIFRTTGTLALTSTLVGGIFLSTTLAAPLAPAAVPGGYPPGASSAATSPIPEGEPVEQASFLVGQALAIAFKEKVARPVVVKTSASLLSRLNPSTEATPNRDVLTSRWMQLAMADPVSRDQRLDAFESFFDAAARLDPAWAEAWALKLPDAAGRVGAFLRLSRQAQDSSWLQASSNADKARRAAKQETDPKLRARALVFLAHGTTVLGEAGQDAAIQLASHEVRSLNSPAERNYLLTELVGAAANYDLGTARKLTESITDPKLKALAEARVNVSEISQTTITSRSRERVALLATAAAPYDARALPILLQLPPEPEVLKAVSQTLPPIFPSARPAISATQLSRIWEFSKTATEGPYRDQLQSRTARLMVLHDLWRGRDWGKQLSWKGGRVQVGAFLKEVLISRSSQLKAGALQDVAKRNVSRAYSDAQSLEPAPKAEALLLLAGQILG